jgi:O-antigen/teichoic acid export membrane protein
LRRRSLLFNSFVYVFGQFISKALGFVLLPIYTRFLLPEDFGITGTLGAYGALLSTVMLLGLNGSIGKHYFDHKSDPRLLRSYVTTVFVFQSAMSLLLVGALELWGERPWLHFTTEAIAFRPYVHLMLWSTLFSTVAVIPQTLYQSEERAGTVVGWQLAQGLAAVAAGVLFVAILRQRALGLLRSQVVSNSLLALIFIGLFMRKWASRELRWQHLRRALRFGLPLLPHTIGSMLMQSIDRIMLEKYAALAEVGLYSVAMMLGMVLLMVGGGVNQAWAPHFFRTMQDEAPTEARRKAETFAALFCAIFSILALIGGMFAPELMRIFIGVKYVPAVPYLIPFVIGNLAGVYYAVPSNELLHAEKTNWFLVATTLATILSVALNLYFLPRGGGAMAAAWIYVAGISCQTAIVILGVVLGGKSLLRARHAVVFFASVAALLTIYAGLGLVARALIALVLFAFIYFLLIRGRLRDVLPPRS